MTFAALIFLILAFLSEVLGTLGGFGSSAVFVPIAGFFFDFKMVLALTAVMHLFSNGSKLILFGKHIDWKTTVLMGIPGVVFVSFGAWLTTQLVFVYSEIALGIFLVLGSSFLLYRPLFKIGTKVSTLFLTGSLSGFLAGFTGTGGPVRALALSSFQFSKEKFIATSSAIDMLVDASRAYIYLSAGYWGEGDWTLVAGLAVIAFLGSLTGKWLLEKLTSDFFRKLVLVIVALVGVIMIFKNIR